MEMVGEAKFTPGPWSVHVEVEQHGIYRGSRSVYVCSSAGWPEGQIARVNVQDELKAREANAAFIVRAVNSHDSLVKALERIAALGSKKVQQSGEIDDLYVAGVSAGLFSAAEIARVALSQAKGGK